MEIIALAGAFGLFMTTLCWNIRRSRCTFIDICGMKCSRIPMTVAELEVDTLRVQSIDKLPAFEIGAVAI